jgi:chemotaxis protein MotB
MAEDTPRPIIVVRRKKAAAAHHGGAWKVAYADFVTAMMAFFLVMWITSQSKSVKQAVANYFNDPFSNFTGGQGGGSSLVPSATGMDPAGGSLPIPPVKPGSPPKSAGRKLGMSGSGHRGSVIESTDPDASKSVVVSKPRVVAVHDADDRSVGGVVLFDEESAELSADAQQRLKGLVPAMVGKPNKIEIRGHATRRPLSPDSPYHDAWDLSFARCRAVKKYLEEQGVEPTRIRLSQGGPFEPYTIAAEPGLQSHNSRVEVHMLNEFAEELVGTRKERAARFTDH